MSISLSPVPHARPTSKPPSPVRPALKLAVRLNPDGAPALVRAPSHTAKHARCGRRKPPQGRRRPEPTRRRPKRRRRARSPTSSS